MTCRDRCRFAQYCTHSRSDPDPWNCLLYFRFEDMAWDAECLAKEYQDEDEIPFSDLDEEEVEEYAED